MRNWTDSLENALNIHRGEERAYSRRLTGRRSELSPGEALHVHDNHELAVVAIGHFQLRDKLVHEADVRLPLSPLNNLSNVPDAQAEDRN
jgi:hypothetical protein